MRVLSNNRASSIAGICADTRKGVVPPSRCCNDLRFAAVIQQKGKRHTLWLKSKDKRECGFIHQQQKIKVSTICTAAAKSYADPVGDPELHTVLELASDAELYELSHILYGKSLLSPIVKSIASGDGKHDESVFDVLRYGGEPEGGREGLLRRLEARFLFLAADAQATLRGRRPTYRSALLQVRERLRVPCSPKLSTPDLEAEIFLHLLQEYSSHPKASPVQVRRTDEKSNNNNNGRKKKKKTNSGTVAVLANSPDEVREGHLKNGLLAAVRLGGQEILSTIIKGGSAVTMSALNNLALGELSAKVLLEKARYNVAKDALVKGSHAVAAKMEAHLAMLTAKQGFKGAATRYAALRNAATLIGPVMWGLFVADVVLRATGTDYARVVRAIFAFAQIRLTKTYGWVDDSFE